MGSASSGDAIRTRQWGTRAARTVTAAAKECGQFGRLTFNENAADAPVTEDCKRRGCPRRPAGEPIDSGVAATSPSVKDWRRARRHAIHELVQPMTASPAEKHAIFPVADRDGGPSAEFSGKVMIKGRPDESSFPRAAALHLRGGDYPPGPDQHAVAPVTPKRHDARDSDAS